MPHTFFVMTITEAVVEVENTPFMSSQIDATAAYPYLLGALQMMIKYSDLDNNGKISIDLNDLVYMIKGSSTKGQIAFDIYKNKV